MSIDVRLRCLFTDTASAAHTINTAWPKKKKNRMEGTREEEGKERKRDEEETKRRGKASAVKMKGGGGVEEGNGGRDGRMVKGVGEDEEQGGESD